MRSRIMCAWALGVTITFAGCNSMTTSGNTSILNDDLIAQVVKGESYKKDVRDLLGEPQNVMFPSESREVWTYMCSSSSGANFAAILGRVPVVGGALGMAPTSLNKVTTVQATAEFDRQTELLTDFVRTINDSTGMH